MRKQWINPKFTPKNQTPSMNQELKENKKFKGASLKEVILPFRLLPDVKEISIRSSYVDPLFEVFGVQRNRNKANIDIVS
jgi:hypothetical protein